MFDVTFISFFGQICSFHQSILLTDDDDDEADDCRPEKYSLPRDIMTKCESFGGLRIKQLWVQTLIHEAIISTLSLI